MGWVLIVLGGLIVLGTLYAFFGKPQSEKEAEDAASLKKNAKYAIPVGIFLILVGLGINSEKTNESSQQVQKTTKDVESNDGKFFNSLDNISERIEELFSKVEIKYTKERSPLADGRYRIIYNTDMGSIEVIGKPKVTKGSLMFYPYKNIAETFVLTLIPFKAFCNPLTESDIKLYTDFLTQGIGSGGGIEKEIAGCKVKFLEFSKQMPLLFVSFEPR